MRGIARTLGVFALCACLCVAASVDGGMGRSLFEAGKGRDGREVGGQVGGSDGVWLRGAAAACAGCHGRDGRGGGEGWVRAPDLRWSALSAAHGRARADGSIRPAYDRASFARALRGSVAPDSVALDTIMPRYDLADDEIDALLSYLQTFDQQTDARPPALVVLTPRETQGPAARVLEGMQRCPSPSQAAHLPALTVLRYDAISDALTRLQAMEQAGEIAAVFAPYLVSVEAEYARASFHSSLPTLLPIAFADINPMDGSRVLFRLPSVRTQAHALLLTLSKESGNPVLAIYRNGLDDIADESWPQVDDVAIRLGWRTKVFNPMHARAADASAVLALATLPAPPVGGDLTGVQVLVPALFMDVAAAQAWHLRGAVVRVAFPYPPQPRAAPGQWIGPEQTWTALSCELLGRLPPMPTDARGIERWREQVMSVPELHLANWFDLPAKSDSESNVGRVAIIDWSFK